uniref:Chromo domain-containing protein n=1 Tax=Meloidogyne enterolobii TaxID=390850 RepID=A0A6V7Y9L4_MELEN|nr:unnamed protein product [Meloidogyne enterolobii]
MDFVVESILGDKTINGVKFYYIKWLNYSKKHNTWLPVSDMDSPDLIAEYENNKNNNFLDDFLDEEKQLEKKIEKELIKNLKDISKQGKDFEKAFAKKDTGQDLFSANRLLAKHKNDENNFSDLGRTLDDLQQQGQQMVNEQIPGSGPVPLRIAEIRAYYDYLKKLADERRKELEGAVEKFEVV